MDQVEFDQPRAPVRTKRLTWDWNDLAEAVQREIAARGDAILQGCWYLNPMFLVHAPEPISEFLIEVRRCQRAWFRTLNRQFRSANWRRLFQVTNDIWQRRTEFTGLLMIDGQEIDPRSQWRLEAELGLRPESDLVVSHRPYAFTCLKNRDWDSLKQISRTELEQHLIDSPNDPIFVTPKITVTGRRPDPAFYAEVQKRSSEWHGNCARILTNRGKTTLARQADCATLMLVLGGTLVVNGQIYAPGCWPNREKPRTKSSRSPSGSPTVSPDYLGLRLVTAASPDGPSLSGAEVSEC
jgi:hypothetical protein